MSAQTHLFLRASDSELFPSPFLGTSVYSLWLSIYQVPKMHNDNDFLDKSTFRNLSWKSRRRKKAHILWNDGEGRVEELEPVNS